MSGHSLWQFVLVIWRCCDYCRQWNLWWLFGEDVQHFRHRLCLHHYGQCDESDGCMLSCMYVERERAVASLSTSWVIVETVMVFLMLHVLLCLTALYCPSPNGLYVCMAVVIKIPQYFYLLFNVGALHSKLLLHYTCCYVYGTTRSEMENLTGKWITVYEKMLFIRL